MAVPRARISKQRRDKRRSANWKLALPGVSKCPKCGEPVLSHRACKACGTYNGREVIKVNEEK
ncbi:MAG: 50S ribosomal protein L32 [Clostridia bacterium]|jgi:large subunit ribosomal protein L32|nr:50S ribosomal protein L32 [Clostridia bacterium]MBO7275699.1 50S ribosomal protein L32 [Clostridia bacterium]MBQ2865389.1 50S ribosomal protein L32 [Clostridia bacterium]MBR4304760.1 50S ribosomal protein L32 [Clostridia bacterium]MBR4954512.1 50S ribosomal protein L32 [Clostridia bacterium]